jgi:hypothetical protein
MPDFAPNFTPRIKVSYRVQGASHSMLFRTPRGIAVGDIAPYVAVIQDFLDGLAQSMWTDWAVLNTSFCAEDSDIFLPCTGPSSPTGIINTSARVDDDKPATISFVGRSTFGLRAAVFVFGTSLNARTQPPTSGDWRYTGAEQPAVADALAALNGLSPALAANDGNDVTWYPYANAKYNDHWVSKARRGG